MNRKIINVTCTNEACTKPLFTLHPTKGGMKIESYGAAMRFAPPRLGVDPKAWAVCIHCETETELPAELAAILLPKK